MSTKRERDAVAQILSDPQYEGRPTDEVIDAAIAALDEARARSRRLAVVGQITFGPQGTTHTVVLGPFSARGILDTEEKFRRAVEGGTAARQAGQDLAWDTKTGTGRGRFMLAPAFWRPRDAWDFYRPEKEVPEIVQRIANDVERWQPGLWGEETPAEPACSCGARGESNCRHCGGSITRHCPRHEPGVELHQCRTAA